MDHHSGGQRPTRGRDGERLIYRPLGAGGQRSASGSRRELLPTAASPASSRGGHQPDDTTSGGAADHQQYYRGNRGERRGSRGGPRGGRRGRGGDSGGGGRPSVDNHGDEADPDYSRRPVPTAAAAPQPSAAAMPTILVAKKEPPTLYRPPAEVSSTSPYHHGHIGAGTSVLPRDRGANELSPPRRGHHHHHHQARTQERRATPPTGKLINEFLNFTYDGAFQVWARTTTGG